VITGNCGISVAPLRSDMVLPMPLSLVDGPGATRYKSFAAYFEALCSTPSSVNVAALVGHTTLRAGTMGSLDRPAAEREIRAMRAGVQEALDAGVIGLSIDTACLPAMKATTQEIIEVARPLSACQALYVTHMRDETDHMIEAVEETFRIGRELGVAVIVSHSKVQNRLPTSDVRRRRWN